MIHLGVSYGTAAPADVAVPQNSVAVRLERQGPGVAEFRILALPDRVVERSESLFLRPRMYPSGDDLERFVQLHDVATEVMIADGPFPAERILLEVVEGETVMVPVSYVFLRKDFSRTVGLEADYGTASANDIVFMARTRVWPMDWGEGTVAMGLRAVRDREVEGQETLILRPVKGDHREWDGYGRDPGWFWMNDTEVEIVITDGPPPCSEVEVEVGAPVALEELKNEWNDYGIYATDIVVDAPASEAVMAWIEPLDRPVGPRSRYDDRTRTLTEWRVETLGEMVRHHMTAQWWNGSFFDGGTPHLELRVCGGAGYGVVVRCSPDKCAVHREGL